MAARCSENSNSALMSKPRLLTTILLVCCRNALLQIVICSHNVSSVMLKDANNTNSVHSGYTGNYVGNAPIDH